MDIHCLLIQYFLNSIHIKGIMMKLFKSKLFLKKNFRRSQNWKLSKYGILGNEYHAVNEHNFNANIASNNACIIVRQNYSTLFCDIEGNVRGLIRAAKLDDQLRPKPVGYFILDNAQLKKYVRLKFKLDEIFYPISSLTKRVICHIKQVIGSIKKKSTTPNLKLNHTVWTSVRLTS